MFFGQIVHKLMQQEDYLAGRLHNNILQKRKWMLQKQRHPKVKCNNQDTSHVENNTCITLKHDLRYMQTLPPSHWTIDDKVLPGTQQWKKRYYMEVEKMTNMHDVHDMCKAYCAGLFWTLQ